VKKKFAVAEMEVRIDFAVSACSGDSAVACVAN
jgi:hypothetical protein